MPGCRKFTESFDLGYVGASANSAANASFCEFCGQCELLRILRSMRASANSAINSSFCEFCGQCEHKPKGLVRLSKLVKTPKPATMIPQEKLDLSLTK